MLNKKKVIQQVTDRGSDKLRKIEGNVKITSNRLTIPPGYLTLGISSETFRKDTGKDTDCKRNENLQGLFSKCLNVESSSSVRRSERILKKNIADDGNNSFQLVNDFPRKLFTNCRHVDTQRTPVKRDKPIWRNRSKSLFKEINEKYVAKTVPYFNDFNILTPPQETTTFYSGPQDFAFPNVNFCENLSKQLHNNPGRKVLAVCRSRILMKIKEINSVLAGDTLRRPKMGANVQFPSTNFLNDAESNFQYYPKSQWIYETPPRQKIILPKLEECQIHPAVIYSTKKDTNIYELTSNINIDLSTCGSGRKINFDKRFLSHVGTLKHEKNFDMETSCHRKTNHKLDEVEDLENTCFPMEYSTSKATKPVFNFTKPNPFIGLISRPRKTEKVSRLRNVLKRKLDTIGYEDSSQLLASGSQSQDMFGKSILPEREDLQHMNFEFKKKLFCDMEIDRETKLDKPNLFDFSQ